MSLFEIDLHGDPMLESALELATQKHDGQARSSGQPYITHSKLVYRILDFFGCDPVQKAVGLLHDVVEESGCTNEQLQAELTEALIKKCRPNSSHAIRILEAWANDVCSGVREMTNGQYTYGGKRSYQINAVRDMSERMKPVKIADQAATVVADGILNFDSTDILKIDRESRFALKGLDVSRACAIVSMPDIEMQKHTSAIREGRLTQSAIATREQPYNAYHEFYKSVFLYFGKMAESAQKQDFAAVEKAKQEFDLESLITKAKNSRVKNEVKAERVTYHYTPSFSTLFSGVARVTVSDKENVVVGFGIISGTREANLVSKKLYDALETTPKGTSKPGRQIETVMTKNHSVRVKLKGLEEYDLDMKVDDCNLNPPMPISQFINIAMEARAIDTMLAARLKLLSRPKSTATGTPG